MTVSPTANRTSRAERQGLQRKPTQAVCHRPGPRCVERTAGQVEMRELWVGRDRRKNRRSLRCWCWCWHWCWCWCWCWWCCGGPVIKHVRQQSQCPPGLKVRTPAHTKHPGWYLEFESRVTQCGTQRDRPRDEMSGIGVDGRPAPPGATLPHLCGCEAHPAPGRPSRQHNGRGEVRRAVVKKALWDHPRLGTAPRAASRVASRAVPGQ